MYPPKHQQNLPEEPGKTYALGILSTHKEEVVLEEVMKEAELTRHQGMEDVSLVARLPVPKEHQIFYFPKAKTCLDSLCKLIKVESQSFELDGGFHISLHSDSFQNISIMAYSLTFTFNQCTHIQRS